jgi:hypothetical protein
MTQALLTLLPQHHRRKRKDPLLRRTWPRFRRYNDQSHPPHGEGSLRQRLRPGR